MAEKNRIGDIGFDLLSKSHDSIQWVISGKWKKDGFLCSKSYANRRGGTLVMHQAGENE